MLYLCHYGIISLKIINDIGSERLTFVNFLVLGHGQREHPAP